MLRQSIAAGSNSNPAFASPDRALVFEVIGPVEKFVEAVERIGFEWLTEDYANAELEDSSSTDDGDDETVVSSLMYITMPTVAGVERLLAMWNRFTAKRAPSVDEQEWWKVFGYLSTIRPWNATDRIDPATQAFIDRQLQRDPDAPVRLEVDLWYRGDPILRATAREGLQAVLDEVGGSVVDFVTIDPIRYQVALVEVPPEGAGGVQTRSGAVANADQIMSIRPQSFFRSNPNPDSGDAIIADEGFDAEDLRPAVAAILDGYPMANHRLLAGRVEVDEVDITGAMVPVTRRYHGTAIASLIIHGDLAAGEEPISRRLKAVPILAAPQGLSDERLDADYLPIGLIYRAVVALKAGLNGNPPTGPDVVLINHSVCDGEGSFIRRPSVWARLLDWMSLEYGVLFVVSAGNITREFPSGFADEASYVAATSVDRQASTMLAVEATKGIRGLLSPAEAMNVLTVGALHLDEAGVCPPGHVDPFPSFGVTNLGSAIGPGINRALKPDLVEAGGRQLASTADTSDGHVLWPRDTGILGQKAAAPDPIAGGLSRTARSTGTSNAAALVTRAGIKVVDALEEMLEAEGLDLSSFERRALATRALLVHGAAWRDHGEVLERIYPPLAPRQWRARRGSITQFLGFGRSDFTRVVAGDTNRITLLADDVISHEQLHEYRIPIPTSMIGTRELRRIVMTLAWSPPFHPTSISYRGAALDIVDADGKRDFWRGLKKVVQPHPDDVRRGTISHFVLEGENSAAFTDSAGLFVGVQARALSQNYRESPVPYALAITLEVAATVREDIYASVSAAVRAAVRPRARIQQ
ncbi:S8 family peptidase [Rhizobium sp. 16-449-1b]|uniref:S8 family peptidase n=1 Tax=Rhizobium sp. 16-449-1b TaxID=2819989 RepID=UPI001AD9A5CC|nr:S8 family peptidase [Rhizobium sp. 16-449-1b]MBO9198230.1 S8 family peptidase [Rhizobium sp. 16-449-1b]